MNMKQMTFAALVAVLGLSIATAPAAAQGNGRGNRDRDRVEQRDRDLDDILRGGRQERPVLRRGNGSGKVPPGWCQGVGNPHNTVENCGFGSAGRWDFNRMTAGYGSDGYGSFDRVHADFHRQLDARYGSLAAQRPLDLQYQLELRLRKRTEHEEWHRRAGIGHD